MYITMSPKYIHKLDILAIHAKECSLHITDTSCLLHFHALLYLNLDVHHSGTKRKFQIALVISEKCFKAGVF